MKLLKPHSYLLVIVVVVVELPQAPEGDSQKR